MIIGDKEKGERKREWSMEEEKKRGDNRKRKEEEI